MAVRRSRCVWRIGRWRCDAYLVRVAVLLRGRVTLMRQLNGAGLELLQLQRGCERTSVRMCFGARDGIKTSITQVQ